jgi:NADH dehydrogenase
MGVTGRAEPGIYELGGPDVDTFRELILVMLGVIRRRRFVLNVPFWMARVMAAGLDFLELASLRLFRNGTLTRDQVRQLARDNIVAEDARGFADLGITPVSMEAVLPDYLWRFRASGQYATMKDSARNLRG